jgi:hypothetical protein
VSWIGNRTTPEAEKMAQKLYNSKSAKHDIALVADLSNGKSADILPGKWVFITKRIKISKVLKRN